MKQAYGETVTTTAFSKKVGYYYAEAIRRSIGLERHGEVRVVMVPVDEYNSLRKLFARALQSEQLKDVIGEITTAPPAWRARRGMSLKFQITSVFDGLSVYDNVLLSLQADQTL